MRFTLAALAASALVATQVEAHYSYYRHHHHYYYAWQYAGCYSKDANNRHNGGFSARQVGVGATDIWGTAVTTNANPVYWGTHWYGLTSGTMYKAQITDKCADGSETVTLDLGTFTAYTYGNWYYTHVKGWKNGTDTTTLSTLSGDTAKTDLFGKYVQLYESDGTTAVANSCCMISVAGRSSRRLADGEVDEDMEWLRDLADEQEEEDDHDDHKMDHGDGTMETVVNMWNDGAETLAVSSAVAAVALLSF
jgi:hypothetical protein